MLNLIINRVFEVVKKNYLRFLKSLILRANQKLNLLTIDLVMIEDMLLIVIKLLKN